jgi:nucleoside-diphosphate-sugar epimerase
MTGAPGHLFAFGCGYSARRLAVHLLAAGHGVSGTARSAEGAGWLARMGVRAQVYDGSAAVPAAAFDGVTDLLVSIPPGPQGDGVLAHHAQSLCERARLRWIGLLSTSGVYGDAQGAWITERFVPQPLTEANRWRLAAEREWLDFGAGAGIAVQVFRLPGIYGPGRSPFAGLRDGSARAIVKPGQVFNRIHVDDIVAALCLGMQRPEAGPVFHIADGTPAAADEVLRYAAALAGLPPPAEIAFEDAGLSAMARHFYAECKRLDISHARAALGFTPRYPDYRSGLAAVLGEEEGTEHGN